MPGAYGKSDFVHTYRGGWTRIVPRIALRLNLLGDTVALAVAIFDRACYHGLCNETDRLRRICTMLTCMFLASKLDGCGVKPKQLCAFSRLVMPKHIVQMEQEILHLLRWQVHLVTPHAFAAALLDRPQLFRKHRLMRALSKASRAKCMLVCNAAEAGVAALVVTAQSKASKNRIYDMAVGAGLTRDRCILASRLLRLCL